MFTIVVYKRNQFARKPKITSQIYIHL